MNAIILSIGDELVLGQTIDTNSAWLSQQLAAVGCDVVAHVTVPDNQKAIDENDDNIDENNLRPVLQLLHWHTHAMTVYVPLKRIPVQKELSYAVYCFSETDAGRQGLQYLHQ